VKQTLLRLRHLSTPQQGAYLRSVVRGFLNYHAVPGNMPALELFGTEITYFTCLFPHQVRIARAISVLKLKDIRIFVDFLDHIIKQHPHP
jgi:hypothetical protein